MREAENVYPYEIKLTSGFWKDREDINKNVTAGAVYQRFKNTGRFAAVSCKWKEGEPNKPHEYWDSDIAKWIEGVSYILEEGRNESLEKIVDDTVSEIEKNMLPCGYFNSFYITLFPEKRFTNRNNHELYCLGHFIEAAIAYKHATGKDKLLKLMIRYADYVDTVFRKENSAAFKTPGHQEIELALIKLYRETGDKKYLELSSFFIEKRGTEFEEMVDMSEYLPEEFQSHIPPREQKEAVGHCVRALYMYCAMADLACETGDEALLATCRELWQDITERKMYITGGVGSDSYGERFAKAYDLPNATAYAETCAAIALMMFAGRMSETEINSAYADIIERVMYNGMLSGVSLDGKKFFYTNPLEIEPRLLGRYSVHKEKPTYQPIQQRVELFECSCCPPNIVRTLASIKRYFYSVSSDTVFVNQFASGVFRRGGMKITQETDYPKSGKVKICAEGCDEQIAIRIPSWCEKFSISKPYTLKCGFAYVSANEVEIEFEMKPCLITANPNVAENGGKAALMRGPLVYCAEEAIGANLKSRKFNPDAPFSEEWDEFIGAIKLRTKLSASENPGGLYNKYKATNRVIDTEFIPYYAFANRGAREMLVWLNI